MTGDKVLQCDQTNVSATLRMVCREEVGPSLQGRVRFFLRVRLQHGNYLDRSIGSFSARWRRLGIFAVAALKRPPDISGGSSANRTETRRQEPSRLQAQCLPQQQHFIDDTRILIKHQQLKSGLREHQRGGTVRFHRSLAVDAAFCAAAFPEQRASADHRRQLSAAHSSVA